MTHDPFQNYATLGSYYGMPAPLGLQYPSLQASGINPTTAVNPLLGLSPMAQGVGIPQVVGQSPYGPNPGLVNQQQLQLASLLASQLGFQNPVLAASLLSNPLVAASLLHSQAISPYGIPQFGQIGSPFGQIGSPFGQIGSPFGQIGYPLAPQTWIGQGLGPVQSQLIPRPFQAQGLSPWGY